jgi:hypothetical protein
VSAITKIQEILGVTPDGIWGPKTQASLDALIKAYKDQSEAPVPGTYTGRKKAQASSFADPADLAAFAKCKREGGYRSNGVWHEGSSDNHCFEVGDNGIGAWGDHTVEGSGPCVAMRASELIAKWGSTGNGRNKIVRIFYKDKTAEFPVKDLLGTPGRVDLNPDACAVLGLKPPVMANIEWEWA